MVPKVGMGSEVHEIGRSMGAASFDGATVSKFRRSGLLVLMKHSLLQVLAQLAQHCPKALSPHLKSAFDIASWGFQDIDETIRSQTPITIAHVLVCMAKNGGVTSPPTAGAAPVFRPDFLKILQERCATFIQ